MSRKIALSKLLPFPELSDFSCSCLRNVQQKTRHMPVLSFVPAPGDLLGLSPSGGRSPGDNRPLGASCRWP